MNLVRRGDAVVRAVHHRLVWALMATYVVAVVWPGPGLVLRNVSLGTVQVKAASVQLTTPMLLLELLLFNASLGVNAAEVTRVARQLRVLILGLLANAVLPVLYTLLVAVVLRGWHNSDELQSFLAGLAFVGAMPIAGSSTAWSQNAEGNVALSLGLVLASTIVSPLLAPLDFHVVSRVTIGDYSQDLARLAHGSTELFLVLAVIVPSVLGLGARSILGSARLERAMPLVKLVNLITLVVLNYVNAAVALPHVLRRPDADYLALVFVATSGLCASAFLAGWLMGKVARAPRSERVSLMFGLGMSNNGSGLVLASTTMAAHPNVLLAIVMYNLVQQAGAAIADRLILARTMKCR